MEGSNQNQNSLANTSLEGGIDVNVLFGNNGHFSFVFKKTEKLVTAVYMITDFIKDNEPLKWKVRESALGLMSLNISFATVSLLERKALIKEYHSLALEIVSLAKVAYHSGLISEMNYTVLSREFGNLIAVIDRDESKKANEETVILNPDFFATSDSYKGQSLRTSVSQPAKAIGITETVEKLPQKDTQAKVTQSAPVKDDKESRRNVILKLLSKKSGLNVKDFIDSIKGVSEKTIQRELLAMVALGLLRKEGERRWSTYSLAQ